MRVPVRRQPETRIGEQQQAYARPVQPLNVEPVTRLIEGVRDQILDGQEARQRIDLSRRLITEVNELQTDFAARQTNPKFAPDNFADDTNRIYTERHATLMNELRQQGYSRDMLDDFDTRLGTVRQNLFERGLAHQVTQLDARAVDEITDIATQASQYAAADPTHNYATASEMLENAIRTHPDLTEARRAALRSSLLAVVRDGGSRALSNQDPQGVVNLLDPHGLTAPYAAPTTPAASEAPAPAPANDSGTGDVLARIRATEGPDHLGGYNALAYNTSRTHNQYGVPQQNLTGMTLGEVYRFQREVMRPRTPGSTGVGAYQFESGTLHDMAIQEFGASWENQRFTPENQDRMARRLHSQYGTSPWAIGGTGGHLVRTRTASAAATDTVPVEAPAFRPAPASTVQTASADAVPTPGQAPVQSDAPAAAPPPPPPQGLRVPGNINLDARPIVHNPDGSVSTVRSISIGTDQGEVLIPTVVNGKVVTDEEAVQHYRQTGEHLGIFDNEADATAYAQQLHEQEAQRVGTSAPDIASIHTGNALIDAMNGPERMQLLARARERLNQVNAATRAQMDVTIQNITAEALTNGGEIATPMPTEQQVLQAYPGPEGPQRWAQLQTVHGVGQAMTAFRTQSDATIQQTLERLRPHPGSATYATEMEIYRHAEQAAQTLRQQRQENPVGYVMQYFPAVREAAQHGTSTREYYNALDQAYRTLGIDSRNAPVMSPEAATQLTRNYQTMTPQQRGDFIRQNMEEMGEDRFRRFVHGMEGTTAETDANIYALLRSYPGGAGPNRILYNQILEGRDIIAQDPAKRPRGEAVTAVFRQVGLVGIRDLNPRTSSAIQQAAEALYVQRGGDPVHINNTIYREALTSVLGGNLPANMTRGRATDYTILPPRVSEQQFRGWMERQTIATLTQFGTERQAPRWGDLRTPATAQQIIDEGVFVMTSPGYYMIRMASDGRPLMTPSGNPYIMRVDARGIMNTQPAPQPHRYTWQGGVM